MSINLTEYINRTNTVTDEKLADVTYRLKTVLADLSPTIDTSANSVFGALILAPLAKIIAMAEDATECILSDIELSNALNGDVCDCEFSEAFIKSLGLDTLVAANTFGILRFVMNAKSSIWDNETYKKTAYSSADSNIPIFEYIEIDQGTSFVFKDAYLFNLIANKEGSIRIINPTSFKTYDLSKDLPTDYWAKNYFPAGVLSMGSDGNPLTYFVDIPISGPSAASVEASSVPSSDIDNNLLTNLFVSNGIYNVQEIQPYETPTTIVAIAKLAQQLYPSSNFSTKGGIASYLRKLYPDLNCISPVTQNDPAGRDFEIGIGSSKFVKANTLDIYAKNGLKEIEVEQIFINSGDSSFDAFLCRPVRIIEATPYYIEGSTISAGATITSQVVSATSPYINSVLYLDSSLVNNLYSTTEPTANTNELSLYNCVNSSYAKFGRFSLSNLTNSYYSYIKVKYTYDPYTLAMDNTLNSKYNSPFISTANKSFVTCYIDNLEIKYKKQIGTYIDRQKIKAQLLEFINTLSYPSAYSDAYLYDIMLINGAKYVTGITITARLRPTTFTSAKSNNITYNYPYESYAITALDASAITSATGFTNVNIPTDTSNVAYYLPESAIKLTEV